MKLASEALPRRKIYTFLHGVSLLGPDFLVTLQTQRQRREGNSDFFFLNSKILSSKGEEQKKKKKSMAFSFPKRVHSFSMPKPDICPHGNPLTGAETQGVKSSELTEIGLSCHLEETCKNL